jgi:hypothetical protein
MEINCFIEIYFRKFILTRPILDCLLRLRRIHTELRAIKFINFVSHIITNVHSIRVTMTNCKTTQCIISIKII